MFDPFGDFETAGYLRNVLGEKNHDEIKRAEHFSVLNGIDDAISMLSRRKTIAYEDVLRTHELLFEGFYPWAGRDRQSTFPDRNVTKGTVTFAQPAYVQSGVQWALKAGNATETIRARPGFVMGQLAFAHPFLDGNGRTIMLVHAELCRRAGFGIRWAETDKTDYLTALTHEIDDPRKGVLDEYLLRHAGPAPQLREMAGTILSVRGLSAPVP